MEKDNRGNKCHPCKHIEWKNRYADARPWSYNFDQKAGDK